MTRAGSQALEAKATNGQEGHGRTDRTSPAVEILEILLASVGGLVCSFSLWRVAATRSFSLFLRICVLLFMLSTYLVALCLLAIMFGNEAKWVKECFLIAFAGLFLSLFLALLERVGGGLFGRSKSPVDPPLHELLEPARSAEPPNTIGFDRP